MNETELNEYLYDVTGVVVDLIADHEALADVYSTQALRYEMFSEHDQFADLAELHKRTANFLRIFLEV